MGSKITTISYQFLKQELINALLLAELPDIVPADIVDIKISEIDNLYFDITLTNNITEEEL